MADPIFAQRGKSLRQMLAEDGDGALADRVQVFLEQGAAEIAERLDAECDPKERDRLSLFESCYASCLQHLDHIVDDIANSRAAPGP